MALFSVFGFYDFLYIAATLVMGMGTAYIRDPQVKAMLATVPVQFSLGYLAVGKPIDTTNAVSCLLVVVFPNVVRYLHNHRQWSIYLAIPAGWFAYAGLGAALVPVLPNTEEAFWLASFISLLVGGALYALRKKGGGIAYKTPMSPFLKAPLLLGIVSSLAWSKKLLAGFTPAFPIMNTIASYEGRHSLPVQCRQILAFAIAGPFLMAAIHMVERHQGSRWLALLAGWVAYLVVFLPINQRLRKDNSIR